MKTEKANSYSSLFLFLLSGLIELLPGAANANTVTEEVLSRCTSTRTEDQCSRELTWALNYCEFITSFSLAAYNIGHPDPQAADIANQRVHGSQLLIAMKEAAQTDHRALQLGPMPASTIIEIIESVERLAYSDATGENVLIRGEFVQGWHRICLFARVFREE